MDWLQVREGMHRQVLLEAGVAEPTAAPKNLAAMMNAPCCMQVSVLCCKCFTAAHHGAAPVMLVAGRTCCILNQARHA